DDDGDERGDRGRRRARDGDEYPIQTDGGYEQVGRVDEDEVPEESGARETHHPHRADDHEVENGGHGRGLDERVAAAPVDREPQETRPVEDEQTPAELTQPDHATPS